MCSAKVFPFFSFSLRLNLVRDEHEICPLTACTSTVVFFIFDLRAGVTYFKYKTITVAQRWMWRRSL